MSESADRSALFLASVSSTLFALGFAGLRDLRARARDSIEDFFYARAIGRIRQYYVEQAVPERGHYFMLAPSDSGKVALRNMAVDPGRWQIYFTNQAMVSVVSAVIGGGLAIAGPLGLSDESLLQDDWAGPQPLTSRSDAASFRGGDRSEPEHRGGPPGGGCWGW